MPLDRYALILIPTAYEFTVVRFWVLMVARMKMRAFWDTVPYSLIKEDRCFGGVYCLHYQDE
jgi:hypothetical protein